MLVSALALPGKPGSGTQHSTDSARILPAIGLRDAYDGQALTVGALMDREAAAIRYGPSRMSRKFSIRRPLLLLVPLLAIAVAIAWHAGLLGGAAAKRPENSILVIAPYRYNGTWVFDDERAGLVREPFVGGVPEMIDVLVEDIPDAADGFRLTFSARPFPDYEKKLTWVRGDMGGNYYKLDDPPMEGWICPALFQYYERAPAELYVKADPAG